MSGPLDKSLAALQKRMEERAERIKNAPPADYESPAEFEDASGSRTYTFPITVMSGNLGRLEVHLEPIWEDGQLKQLYLQFGATRDERYNGIVFVIPAYAQRLSSFSFQESRGHTARDRSHYTVDQPKESNL
jgi:hypothetical protein